MSDSILQKVLHGLSALIIIWLLMSGFYIGLITTDSALKVFVGELNVSVGLLLVLIFILRLCVSFGHGYGALECEKKLTPWLDFLVHKMMYVSVMTVLITGVFMTDRPIIFNVVTFFQPLNNVDLARVFGRLHTPACVMLAALVTLHVAAVIKHQASTSRAVSDQTHVWLKRYFFFVRGDSGSSMKRF